MRNIVLFTLGMIFFVVGCTNSKADNATKNWPKKLQNLETGLKVTHSADTIFAAINTKDPEQKGRYQLQFTTTVESIDEDLEIVEFAAYFWENEKWVFKSMFDRPFNKNEFDKWYNSENGQILLGETYSDNDNWLVKSDYLNGETYKALLYFIARNKQGEKFVGAREIVGEMKMKN